MKTGAGDDPFADDEEAGEEEDEESIESKLEAADEDVDDIIDELESEHADERAFEDELLGTLAAVDDGEIPNTISVRDGSMKAMLEALEADDEMRTLVGQAFQRSLGRETDDEFGESEIVRLALRAGFEHAAPEAWAKLEESVAKRTQQTV